MSPPDGTAESVARTAERGTHDGDRRLRRIARAGRHWKKTQTRRIDQESKLDKFPEFLETFADLSWLFYSVYVYRLCLEWARLWSDNREEMVYEG